MAILEWCVHAKIRRTVVGTHAVISEHSERQGASSAKALAGGVSLCGDRSWWRPRPERRGPSLGEGRRLADPRVTSGEIVDNKRTAATVRSRSRRSVPQSRPHRRQATTKMLAATIAIENAAVSLLSRRLSNQSMRAVWVACVTHRRTRRRTRCGSARPDWLGGWSRSANPPRASARPSQAAWHGNLRDPKRRPNRSHEREN
jgi:hypothetical protein